MTKAQTLVSAPIDVAGSYPSHYSKNGKGGLHIVANEDERFAIPHELLDDKTIAHELDSKLSYRWNGTEWNPHVLQEGTEDLDEVIRAIQNDVQNNTSNISNLESNYLTFTDADGNQTGPDSNVSLLPPLKLEVNHDDVSDTTGYALTMTHENETAKGFYATVSSNQELIRLGTDQNHYPLFFDNVVVGNSLGIYATEGVHGYNIENLDGFGAHTNYLIDVMVSLYGTAPANGTVHMYLIDLNESADGSYTQFMYDSNDMPLFVEHYFKQGESFGSINLSGIVSIDTSARFQVQIVTSFDEKVIVNGNLFGNANTGILIQELSQRGSTSDALQQFEIDTGKNLRFTQIVFKDDFITEENAFLNVQQKTFIDRQILKKLDHWFYMWGGNGFYYEIKKDGYDEGYLEMSAVGDAAGSYEVGITLDTLYTYGLRGHDVTFTTKMQNHDASYDLQAYKYTGNDLAHAGDNMDNWTLVKSESHVADSSAFRNEELTVTVPEDAKLIAFMIKTTSPQKPATLQVKTLRLSAPEFTYSVVSDQYQNRAYYVGFDKMSFELQKTSTGWFNTGFKDILSVDESTDIIEFKEDGEWHANTTVTLFNNTDADTETTVGWYYKEGDNLSLIPETEHVLTVKANTQNTHVRCDISSKAVEKGQKYVLKASNMSAYYFRVDSTFKRVK